VCRFLSGCLPASFPAFLSFSNSAPTDQLVHLNPSRPRTTLANLPFISNPTTRLAALRISTMNYNLGTRGLEASRWAGKGPVHYTPHPGDWSCQKCKFSNFSSRLACYHCSTPKYEAPAAGVSHAHHVSATPQSRNHEHSLGGLVRPYSTPNTPSNTPRAIRAQSASPRPRPSLSQPEQPHPSLPTTDRLDTNQYGLATSRWAPRSSNPYRREKGSSPQIWTRVRMTLKPGGPVFFLSSLLTNAPFRPFKLLAQRTTRAAILLPSSLILDFRTRFSTIY
jgi:hypothetical protein